MPSPTALLDARRSAARLPPPPTSPPPPRRYRAADRSSPRAVTDGGQLIKDIVGDSDDFATIFINQQRIMIHPHPDRAIRRRRQGVIGEVDQPIIPHPESGRQEFAKRPAMGIPTGWAAIERR